MNRYSSLVRCFLGVAACLVAAACSSSDKADKPRICNTPGAPATLDPSAAQVSFNTQIVPILTQSCATTQCHGEAASNNTVPLAMGSGASTMHVALVNKPSVKLSSMAYVKSGDADQSFLMRKIDATHCALDSQCQGSTCGDSMPNEETLLSTEQRDLFRRWILQGAKKD